MASAPAEPQNVDAEEAVLGAMLISEAAVDRVAELLEPSHFYRESYASIFGAVVKLRRAGEPIEPLVVAAELERLGTLNAIGGKAKLAELAGSVTAASNVAHYAALVLDAARSRSVYRAATAIGKAALNGGLALHPELIDETVMVLEHARVLPGEPGLPEGPIFLSADDFVGTQVIAPEPLLGTDKLPILARGSFNLLVGRPGAGKTTLLIDLMCHLAAGLPWPTADADERAPAPWPCARPLNIAFIENEGPQESFRGKLEEKLRRFPHEIEGRILIQTLRWGVFSFADRSLMARVRAELDENEIDLVMGDPLGSLGLEGVGSPAETLAFIQLLRPLGLGTTRAFLFLHHFRERVDKDDDELSRISGAWGGHIDTQMTLAATHSEDQLRLAYPKIRWARARYPHPVILGKVWNTLGFCALSEEGDVSLLEPRVHEHLETARTEARGLNGWCGVDDIRDGLGARRTDVLKALEGAPHLFRLVTGVTAKRLGAKSGRAKLWGLAEWHDGRPELEDESETENSGQELLAGEDGIPF